MNSQKITLRKTAFIAAFLASIVSVALMLRACRFNDSPFALVLIALWILSPMAALALADLAANRWPILGRSTVNILMLLLAAASLIIYGIDVLIPLSPRRGFPYALIPLVSWLLLAIVLAVAAFRTHRKVKN